MSRQLAKTMGTLEAQGVYPLLRSAFQQEWGGALRLRGPNGAGALWLVKGQVAHAALHAGEHRAEGPEALTAILAWREGTYFIENDALPPARTIRQPMDEILDIPPAAEEVEGATRAVLTDAPLASLLETLRERVPGLESLSVTKGRTLEATTTCDEGERDWLDGQLRRYFAEDRLEPERLFVQQGNHTLLILSRGTQTAVLSAGAGTAPEALFWAGEEARKHMLMTD
jgi:hypothetical protein